MDRKSVTSIFSLLAIVISNAGRNYHIYVSLTVGRHCNKYHIHFQFYWKEYLSLSFWLCLQSSFPILAKNIAVDAIAAEDASCRQLWCALRTRWMKNHNLNACAWQLDDDDTQDDKTPRRRRRTTMTRATTRTTTRTTTGTTRRRRTTTTRITRTTRTTRTKTATAPTMTRRKGGGWRRRRWLGRLGVESHGRERAWEMRAWGGRACRGVHAGGSLKAGGEGLRCAEEGLEWMACRGMPGGEAWKWMAWREGHARQCLQGKAWKGKGDEYHVG